MGAESTRQTLKFTPNSSRICFSLAATLAEEEADMHAGKGGAGQTAAQAQIYKTGGATNIETSLSYEENKDTIGTELHLFIELATGN